MRSPLLFLAALCTLPLAACGGDSTSDAGTDSGAHDAGTDSGPHDGGGDSGPTDAGTDLGAMDLGVDAGPVDAGFDAGTDGGVDFGPVDAGPAFACAGGTLPTTAPATITLTGTTNEVTLAGTAALGTVDASATDATGAMVATTSDAAGAYMLTLGTNSLPLDTFIAFTKTGYVDTYSYPPVPWTMDAMFSPVLIQSTLFSGLSTLAGASTRAGNGSVFVDVTDCMGNGVPGATVFSSSGGTVRYTAGGVPSSTATMTDANGSAVVFDVPPGATTITAFIPGVSFRPRTVTVVADAISETTVVP